MEPRDYWWNEFMETGRVDAYLEYKSGLPQGGLPYTIMGVQRPDEIKDRRGRPAGFQAGG